ncbi:alpha/beta hydrolase [Sediminimonas sp.]|uniref:alpha/beta fold hydrolase n=1 Tax=Sediminimonas sp. TaxID=2823379 RepID=UPI0034590C7C
MMAHFTTSDGLSLYYEDAGTGLPVLCLAGLTRNGCDFDFVAPHMADVRMIRLDARGRGRSDHASDAADYAVPVEARDALALLDHLGLDKAAILGTSRGGIVGMYLAATAHDRLLGVALNDIGPVVEAAGLGLIRAYVGQQPQFDSLDALAEARARMAAPQFPGVPLSRWREEVERTHVMTPDGPRVAYDPRLSETLEGGSDAPADMWPLFDAIAPLPAAVIHGRNSDLLSAETVAGMARRNPDLIVAHVPDRGHIPFLDEAESLEVLRAWLTRMT